MEGRPRSSNHRASFAVLLGLAAVLSIPAAVVVARQSPKVDLLDAAWGAPAAVLLGLLAVAFANLARTRIHRTVGRAGGEGRIRAARILAFLGVCVAASAGISVLVYELLRRLEK